MVEVWHKLNRRERALTLAVAVLVGVWAAYAATTRALSQLERLDRTIERLENDLVLYNDQLLRKDRVEVAFAEVATQHSSAWTEQEIHDRLRQEIYRLALRQPPLVDAPLPKTGVDASQYLVDIPSLGGAA